MKVGRLVQGIPGSAKTQMRAVLSAWSHFTCLPLPARLAAFISEDTLRSTIAARYLPLVSALVGLGSAGIFWLVLFLTGSKGVAVVGAVVSTIAVTGAFRERGTGYFFDAFSKSKTSKPAPAIGTAGIAAIMLLILAKYQLLMAMPSTLMLAALIAAQAFSSFVAVAFLFTHKPLQPEMHDRYTTLRGVRLTDTDFIILAFVGMLPAALLAHPVFIALLPILWVIRAVFSAYLAKQPERYTSDALAATQQLAELGFYFGILVIIRFISGI